MPRKSQERKFSTQEIAKMTAGDEINELVYNIVAYPDNWDKSKVKNYSMNDGVDDIYQYFDEKEIVIEIRILPASFTESPDRVFAKAHMLDRNMTIITAQANDIPLALCRCLLLVKNFREENALEEGKVCPHCHGTTLDLSQNEDGGTCPHCFNGYVK